MRNSKTIVMIKKILLRFLLNSNKNKEIRIRKVNRYGASIFVFKKSNKYNANTNKPKNTYIIIVNLVFYSSIQSY
jgi:hypothetical protein